MLPSLRTALLICAALGASSVTPALAGQSDEPLIPAASATLPTITVPQLLDPDAEPVLSEPDADVTPAEPETVEAQPVIPTGDLSAMVAQLRSADPGSRELECLATGIYFESKS